MFKLSAKTEGRRGTQILLDAMSKDKVHLAKFVLDALDDKIVDSKTEGAQTPLISSILLPDSEARAKFIRLLLQRGASVNHADECGRTALSHACEKGYLDAVKILVQNNANPEMEDLWGNTALMYAVVAGHSMVVQFLVRAFKRLGLQIDRQNKVGNSATKVARYLGHKECLHALKNPYKKGSEYNIISSPVAAGSASVKEDGGAQEDAPLQNSAELELSAQTRALFVRHEGVSRESSHAPKTVLGRRRSLIVRHRLQSMDSIEEYEKESECSPTTPQSLFFAGVSLKTPQRSSTPLSPRQGEKAGSADEPSYLPPLPRKTSHLSAAQFSPRPFKTVSKSSASETSSPACFSSPLVILMTPITESAPLEGTEQESVRKNTFDFSIRRFDDSYYQKRCSLPTSLLSPLPPERAQTSVRKFKAAWRNPATQDCTELTGEVPLPTAQTALSVLGNRLLRRFTFPEFKKTDKDPQGGSCSAQGGTGEAVSRGMPRSETFPMCTNHPQVGSKPSIDSISAVKCEFDFQFKVAPPKASF